MRDSGMAVTGRSMARARSARRLFQVMAALPLASLCVASAQAQAPATPVPAGTVFEVKPGDSFGRIAARVTGNIAQWRQLYNPQKSGLPNPDLIVPGARLELVREADGSAYLRHSPAAGSVALAAAKPATVAPVPKPAASVAAPKPPAVAAAPAAAPRPAAAAPAGLPTNLTLGVLPNIPTPALMAQNEPLKAYLERSNSNKVNVTTAANFRAFFEAAMKGEYDVVVIAANLARVAQLDGGMQPIAFYEPRIRALLIGAREQGIKSAKELKGRTVVFQNPQSLVALYARQWLLKQDLQSERDFEVKSVRTDIGVGRMILAGEAAAAIMSNGEFRQIPAADAERLVIVEQIAEVPNFMVLAHPRLGSAAIQTLRNQFLAFSADPIDGAAFTKATGVQKIVAADDRQLVELDAFLEPTRRAMGVVK